MPDEAAIAAAMTHARRLFDELSRLLATSRTLREIKVSLAEMMFVPQIDFLSQAPERTELPGALPISWPGLNAPVPDRASRQRPGVGWGLALAAAAS